MHQKVERYSYLSNGNYLIINADDNWIHNSNKSTNEEIDILAKTLDSMKGLKETEERYSEHKKLKINKLN